MSNFDSKTLDEFCSLVDELPKIGLKVISSNLIRHAQANQAHITKSIKELPLLTGAKAQSAIIISAGPSVHKRDSIRRILKSQYQGTVIAVDGAYIACLKAGLIPDFVMTLDPNSTRVVRWFGDPNFEKNSANDDYFARQDLDVEFRKNSIAHNNENIKLVNRYAHLTKALVSTSASESVVQRLLEAKFDMYWWNPLVDSPDAPDSLTRKLYQMNGLPCMNTGGTVGTAAWVFATSRLKIPHLGVVGMDLGYYLDTPIEQTQTYYELIEKHGTVEGIEKFFVEFEFPLTKEKFYTDPTYFWYRKNFFELIKQVKTGQTFNCTEAGTLIGEGITCISLDEFLQSEAKNG